MYFPLIGERVWVSGSSHEFTVVRADYPTSIATVTPVADKNQVKCCPFHQLFAYDQFDDSQVRDSMKEAVGEVLESSRVTVLSARIAIRDMRQTAISTSSIINRSRELIAQTDTVIARWKSLGSKP
jgi:S1-C subfamily serine protease